MKNIRSLPAGVALAMALSMARADQPISGEQFMQQFGVDLETVEITVETLAPGVHVLFGAGGNVLVSIGDDGVLIVDDQFPPIVPKLEAAIRELGGGAVDFAVNTHWHFDHADGNLVLGEQGTWIVAHEKSREMLTADRRINLVSRVVAQPAYPRHALPVITFDTGIRFHLNGDTIDVMHFAPAHTTGDAAVLLREANVVHMGDVFRAGGYPFIDADNGGSIDGVVEFCEAVIAETNAATTVVPGHGNVATQADLVAYAGMLRVVRDRIAALVAEGATLEDVAAAAPTRDFDETYGNPALLVDRAYASLVSSPD